MLTLSTIILFKQISWFTSGAPTFLLCGFTRWGSIVHLDKEDCLSAIREISKQLWNSGPLHANNLITSYWRMRHNNSSFRYSNSNQRLEEWVWWVFLLYNWYLYVSFGWPPTTDMAMTSYFLKFTIKHLNSSCLASDLHQLEIEVECVTKSKIAAKAWNGQASMINTRGTS